jgi:hypothetical protein
MLGFVAWWNTPENYQGKRSDWLAKMPAELTPDPEPLSEPLKRALATLDVPPGVRKLIRPLRGQDAWAVVLETAEKDDLKYHVDIAVRATHTGLVTIKADTNGAKLVDILNDRFMSEIDHLTTGAIAEIILRNVRTYCKGICARRAGGVYFVHQVYAPQLERLKQVLTDNGGDMTVIDVSEKAKPDVLKMVIDDVKAAAGAVQMAIDARHKTDAIVEGKAAMDRLDFFEMALGELSSEAARLKGEINAKLLEILE